MIGREHMAALTAPKCWCCTWAKSLRNFYDLFNEINFIFHIYRSQSAPDFTSRTAVKTAAMVILPKCKTKKQDCHLLDSEHEAIFLCVCVLLISCRHLRRSSTDNIPPGWSHACPSWSGLHSLLFLADKFSPRRLSALKETIRDKEKCHGYYFGIVFQCVRLHLISHKTQVLFLVIDKVFGMNCAPGLNAEAS